DAAPDDAMSVEQVDVVEDLPTAARANAAVRALVADPGPPAARSSDHLHASSTALTTNGCCRDGTRRPPVARPVATAQAVDQDADDPPAVLGPSSGHGLAQLGDGVQEVVGSDVGADRPLGRGGVEQRREG